MFCPTPSQRAHQNSLENESIMLALMTISGLQVRVCVCEASR